MEFYEERGLWWVGEPTVVHSVEVIDDFAPHVRVLRVVRERSAPSQLIDPSGTVHEALDAKAPNVEENVFVRESETAPWLLRDFIDLGPSETP